MEEPHNAVRRGLSPEVRRNLVETSATLPRDKENAGANSSIIRRSHSLDRQVKQLGSAPVLLSTSFILPSTRTPSHARLASLGQQHHRLAEQQQPFTSNFCSPVSTPSVGILAASYETAQAVARQQQQRPETNSFSSTSRQQQQNQRTPIRQTPQASFSLPSYYCSNKLHLVIKSPPGSSKLLRKHFQHLAMTSPPRWANHHQQQQRLLASGPVRLTPTSGSAHKTPPSAPSLISPRRVGYDGTMYTPSKELLKSTACSRGHCIDRTAAGQPSTNYSDNQHDDSKPPASSMAISSSINRQDYHQLVSNAYQFGDDDIPPGVSADDDELSTAASTSMDDMSFEVPVAYQLLHNGGHQMLAASNNVMLSPESPLPPRQGSSNPVALTLLNDGKEDYHFLVAQDALLPVPTVGNDVCVHVDGPSPRTTDMSLSSGSTSISHSSSTAAGLSPRNQRNASPAEVRGTLSLSERSTLARPVAVMAKPSASSVALSLEPAGGPMQLQLPSEQEQQQQQTQYRHPAAATRLIMRSQPREVR